MDRYAMNRCMRQTQPTSPYRSSQCTPMPYKEEEKSMYAGLDALPLAMGYVPRQKFHHTFELCKALQVGTIFPELCKPFCGERRRCR